MVTSIKVVQILSRICGDTSVDKSELRRTIFQWFTGYKLSVCVRGSAGYVLVTAGTGEEALALYKSDPADMVITDLHMPEMDGNALIRRLREINSDLRIIVMTGHTTFADEQEAVADGASIILKKPVSLRELSQRLQQLTRQ